MSVYDFDKVIERRGSGALKYDALQERYGDPGLLPLWVADMDFETPSFIMEAIRRRLDHPILGYSIVPEGFWKSVIDWTVRHHDWKIEREWLNYVPGIVKGIGMVVNVFTSPGDKVVIQTPVYHLFHMVPEGNGRVVVENPLLPREDGLYRMDLEGLEKIVRDDKCKLLILSNPHNPAGIVWDKDTLREVARICHDNGVLVISDEIHCDMTLSGYRHTPFASVSDKAKDCSITFLAPTKTFNMPGVVSAFAVIPSEKIRTPFFRWLDANELSEPTVFAPPATMAAYSEEGDRWRKAMLAYVEQNIEFLEDFCEKHIPAIKPVRPEASFLVWLDCRKLGLTDEELVNLFEKEARLALNSGVMFRMGGSGYMRINVGTPRAILKKALVQLSNALQKNKL